MQCSNILANSGQHYQGLNKWEWVERGTICIHTMLYCVHTVENTFLVSIELWSFKVTRVHKHKPCTRVFPQLVFSSPKLKLVCQLLWSVTLLLIVISAIGLQPLSLKTYAARFSTLLFAEELQMEVDMREFDMERVRILLCWSDVLIVSR